MADGGVAAGAGTVVALDGGVGMGVGCGVDVGIGVPVGTAAATAAGWVNSK